MSWILWGVDEPEGARAVCDPCPVCGGSLPCYGPGLDAEAMSRRAVDDPKEAQRRIEWHVRVVVLEAGAEGITEAEVARRLGLAPVGCDDVARLVEPPGPDS